jgi:UDP-N-acetylmuramoyl-tripeptide--D-alanyl-D-alanine ligase
MWKSRKRRCKAGGAGRRCDGHRAVVALTAGFVMKSREAVLTGPASATFTGVSIDSRTVGAGMLFVAIRGEHLDGHAFVEAAIHRGGRCPRQYACCSERRCARRAGAGHRGALQALGEPSASFGGQVVAITGSAGKTSTKELIADVLSARWTA